MCSLIKTSVSETELKNNSPRATETPLPPQVFLLAMIFRQFGPPSIDFYLFALIKVAL